LRKINITNAKKRDAILGFEAKPTKSKIKQVLKDGSHKNNIRVLKSTLDTDITTLSKQYENLEELGTKIIATDIECDIETTGMLIGTTHKVYTDSDNRIVYNIKLIEVKKDTEGKEVSRKPLIQKNANIALDNLPIQWSDKAIPKAMAIQKFVFAKHYQIRHINGLTFDFLYDMAKELSDKNSLMFVGAGQKGNEPLLITSGGTSYRGLLEGRVQNKKYILILHLTNLELKEFTK